MTEDIVRTIYLMGIFHGGFSVLSAAPIAYFVEQILKPLVPNKPLVILITLTSLAILHFMIIAPIANTFIKSFATTQVNTNQQE